MRVYSIFRSIDGEVNSFHQGRLTTFIRFSQCNLACSYCDTVYAQSADSGKEMSVDEILETVAKMGGNSVTITGGEPLLQQEGLNKLIPLLLAQGINVSVETNGTCKPIHYTIHHTLILNGGWECAYCSYVMDFKLPSSGMYSFMHYNNFLNLQDTDWVKFVIGTRGDFDLALYLIEILKRDGCKAQIAFSPVFGLEPSLLVQWMIDSSVDAVMSLQIHKYIWPNATKEV